LTLTAGRFVDWFALLPVINWRLELGTQSVWAMGRSVRLAVCWPLGPAKFIG